jgi:hypothetical protein
MADELSRVAERLRQSRVGAVPDTAADMSLPRTDGFAVGDRAFDVLTGTDGAVVNVLRPSAMRSATIVVNLDSGEQVMRAPGQLIRRPRRPSPTSGS